jgi:TetR/AcrR family transcriptional regulator, regulator of autoinduction and epiphytic fitness
VTAAPGGASRASELDPRVERSRRVIIDATLDELAEVGYGALNIESVARRAGVGKATVYRQWPGKLALVADALDTLKPAAFVPTGGTVRERIVALLHALVGIVNESRWSSCMPAIIDAATRDPAVREFHHRFTASRRAVMVGLIEEAKAGGELPPELDAVLAAELLAGPIFYRKLMSDEPFDPAMIEVVVDRVLPELSSSRPRR